MGTKNELKLFQGGESGRQLLFNYNQTALSCGLFKMLGQIISHSVFARAEQAFHTWHNQCTIILQNQTSTKQLPMQQWVMCLMKQN